MRRHHVAAIALLAACASGSDDDGEGSAGLGGSTGNRTDTGAAAGSGDDAPGTADDGPADPDGSGDPPAAGCGDGVADVDEECDDGNLEDGDGCNADCRVSGQLQWQHVGSAGFGLIDDANDVTVAPDGSIYAVGFSDDVAEQSDLWIRKLNDTGGMMWTELLDGPANADDQLRGTVADALGYVYLAGFQRTTGQGANLWVRKIGPEAEAQWTDVFNGQATGNDVANDIVIDPDGNLVVVGYETRNTGGRDVLFRKYSAGGSILWTRTWGGNDAGHDQGWDVAAAPDGHLYLAGETTVTGEDLNTWVAKADTDGNILWTRGHNGAAGLADRLRGVAADDDGVVVCGYEDHDVIPWQSFVRKYDGDGVIVWTDIYQGGSGEGAHCMGIERAPNGDFVWVGAENFEGIRHVVVRRIDPDGNERWRSVLPAMADGDDIGRDLAFANDGSIIVAGRVDAGTDDYDAWVASLTP